MKVSNNSNKEAVDVAGLARSKKSAKAQAAKQAADLAGVVPGAATGAGEAASVELSTDAKALSQAKKVAQADNSDQAKIDRIKAMINNGSYKPDFGKVAEKVVNEQMLQELS